MSLSGWCLFFLRMFCGLFFLRNLCLDDNGNIAPPDAPIVKSKTTRNDLNNKLKCTHFLAHDLKNCGLDLVASNSVISNPPCLKLNPFPLILFFSHLLSAISKSPPFWTWFSFLLGVLFDTRKFRKCEPEILVKWFAPAFCRVFSSRHSKNFGLSQERPLTYWKHSRWTLVLNWELSFILKRLSIRR